MKVHTVHCVARVLFRTSNAIKGGRASIFARIYFKSNEVAACIPSWKFVTRV